MAGTLKNDKKLKMGKQVDINHRTAAGIVRFYCLPDVEYFQEDDVTRLLEKRGTWEKVNEYGQRRLRVEIDHSQRIAPDRLLWILQECLPFLKPDTRSEEIAACKAKIFELSLNRIYVKHVKGLVCSSY